MNRLTGLFKHHNHGGGTRGTGKMQDPSPGGSPFPSQSDLFRYRKQRGVNLGSWFVLERWIADAPFRFAKEPAQSDLDVARGSYAKEVLERHWDSWISEPDWEWIARRGINTVRIPIGYYHLCGVDPTVIQGTDFADHLRIFEGAWNRVTNALTTASRYGLGVLIDLHAAPGKQNRDSHSGTSAKDPQFFTKTNMKHTTQVLITLLEQLTQFAQSHNPPLSNLVGIELINEPQPDNNHPMLERWYVETSSALRRINPHIPIYIGDSWMTDQYAAFIERQSGDLPFFVLDHHLYRCFTESDANTSVEQHIAHLSDPNSNTAQILRRVSQKLSAQSVGGALVIGEWSGALNPGSLQGIGNDIEARRNFVGVQLTLYEEHCAGWYFWTYKKEHPGDKGWSLTDAVSAGVFPSVVGLRCNPEHLRYDQDRPSRKQVAKDSAFGQHMAYWSQHPGNYEHWRFEHGFIVGWDDAWLFFESVAALPPHSPVPELGFKGPWLRRRLQQHVQDKGGGNGLWEFEHGFSQGLMAGYDDLQAKLGIRR
ncbi:hypothetical protein QCA50_011322 [Cerrena zonata]|uniref:Glycoside hydrolase family 5 domain-containing protein n=1 Tax=Cerrena zonata TaxID=2478898 RepID=A0AAW0G2B5_9APHY